MTPEKSAVERFIRACPANWHIQKIETNITSGVPDLSVAMVSPRGTYGREFWVEMKAGINPEIRPFQIAWWHKRVCARGRVWMIWIRLKEWNAVLVTRELMDALCKTTQTIKAKEVVALSNSQHSGTTLAQLIQTLEDYN